MAFEYELEWDALVNDHDENRDLLAAESAKLTQALWDESNVLREDLDAFTAAVDQWLDDKNMYESHAIHEFLNKYPGYLTAYPWTPVGYNVVKPVYGYSDYGYGKAMIIRDAIDNFGLDTWYTFEDFADAKLLMLRSAKDMVLERAKTTNTDQINNFTLATDNFIGYITYNREDSEAILQDTQDGTEEDQTESRTMIQDALFNKKVEILAEIEILQNKLYNYSGYAHGAYEIKEKIKALEWKFKQAVKAAKEEFANEQSTGLYQFSHAVDTASDAYAGVLADKEFNWAVASKEAVALADQTLTGFEEEFRGRYDALFAEKLEGIAIKEAELQAEYDAVNEKISHIHDYHLQHEL